MADFPLRHLSIRVPWHDAGWAGVVCQAPHLNGACVKLKGIAAAKDEEREKTIAARSFDELPREQWPCCVDERATFMAPFEMEHLKKHALAKNNPKQYGHFRPTPQRYPAYSAGIVPFRWLSKKNYKPICDLYELDVDEDREPDLGYESDWIHEVENQKTLLESFVGHLRKQDSLCFFYAKHVPFVEGTGRILIGAGRINEIGNLLEYKRQGEGMRGMVWERPVQHSIRPKGKDGFLVPYDDVLRRVEQDSVLDMERYVAKAPEEHWDEFSYASELVTHDGAIGALLSLESTLRRMESELGIATGWQRQWIHDELVRLWTVRGPFPGLGAVLGAFGLSRGVFVAHALQQKAGDNNDPWPLVDSAFRDPSTLPKDLRRDLKELAPTWKGLKTERKAFLRLLSRFELTKDQADALYEESSREKAGWRGKDREILQNPYSLYELSRLDPSGLPLLIIDRGIFPEDSVRLKHPLEKPSQLESAVDLRRVRAFSIAALEEAALNGHTLLPHKNVIEFVLSRPVHPPCPVTGDMLSACVAEMAPEISSVEAADGPALQLQRYQSIGQLVRKQVLGRVGGERHTVDRKWTTLLDKKFGAVTDDEEKRARTEKSAALRELAESRFSVLAGPAGTGKTSLLGILWPQSEIQNDGVLLLAPTGKARVRIQELATGQASKALTLAQFLNANDRYDAASGRYLVTGSRKAIGFGTVIVDEASMLTEDMLGALFDALQGVKRFIFVGDPAQLPPIGAGRPFVDIIAKLRSADFEMRFPRVGPGYAELTIERRQLGKDRPDLRLARWFSTTAPSPGDDDIFSADAVEHPSLRFVEWQKPDEFQAKLMEVLAQELQLSGSDDFRGFNRALNATVTENYDYFNATRDGRRGAVAAVDAWQILSPLRAMPFGVGDINRQVHERYRRGFLELALQQWRSIPKPMGAERILYGDKVINLRNHRRDGKRVYPQEGALGYLANGEIGITVGQWKTRGNPKILKVEFSSQCGFTYDFYKSDFRDEGDPALELAYALTVHKAQGSQFKLVVLVLPEGHPIMSRELVYTALSRHQDRVIVMHQGPRSVLKQFAAPHRSETARRMTNLLQNCKMVEFPQPKGTSFLQEGLIHRTSTGVAVRSKSEVIIFDALKTAGFEPEYEKPLTLGGITRYPDFTIEDEISGRTVYWEHLGMLEREDYRTSWAKKLAWYRTHGVMLAEEGPGPKGILVTTQESSTTGFDSSAVQSLIRKHLAS